MALPISCIPELKGEPAARFVAQADLAYANRGSIDFQKQMATMRAVLKKAKL